MSRVAYANEAFTITYDTEGTQTGLTDLRVDYYDPLDAHDPATDFVMLTEVGSTGVYKGSFTPTAVGNWTLIASSAVSNPPISDKAMSLDVLNHSEIDLAGAGFVSGTDSLEAISNAVAVVAASINAPSARGGLI